MERGRDRERDGGGIDTVSDYKGARKFRKNSQKSVSRLDSSMIFKKRNGDQQTGHVHP